MFVAIIGLRFSSFMLGEEHGIGFQSVLPYRRNGVVVFVGSLLSRACMLLFSYMIFVFISFSEYLLLFVFKSLFYLFNLSLECCFMI